MLKWFDYILSGIVYIALLVGGAYFSFTLLNENLTLYSTEQAYVPYKQILPTDKITINIQRDELYKDSENNQIDKLVVDKSDYYMLSDGTKQFLISDTKDSYNYGFITRKKSGDITYLFSHNSYKYTENSGYHIYNNWKEGDIITFDNKDQYIIRGTKMYDFTKKGYEDDKVSEGVKIIYFTCTPYGEDIRKAYYLEKIKDWNN